MQKDPLYSAQCENTAQLFKAIKAMQKQINSYVRKKDTFNVATSTKLLALLYSAWSEAVIFEMVLTPSGLSQPQSTEIRHIKKKHGLYQAWRKLIEFATDKITSNQDKSRVRECLEQLKLEKYLEAPARIRNKLAHGQWVQAFNQNNTKLDPELSKRIETLDYVHILNSVEVHRHLSYFFRDLIQSPTKGFMNRYENHIKNLEDHIRKTSHWSIASKKVLLQKKKKPS